MISGRGKYLLKTLVLRTFRLEIFKFAFHVHDTGAKLACAFLSRITEESHDYWIGSGSYETVSTIVVEDKGSGRHRRVLYRTPLRN